ncbi:MAG TPA: DUF3347 domain-containing protein [Chitinophagaceae bacterium]|nr:DUF3347 domain-containing protein [Chitinophagaceae bacterium]
MKTFILMIALTVTAISAYSNPPSKLDEVVIHYLHLKNALATDNTSEAARAGEQLQAALITLGTQTMSEAQKKAYSGISEDAEKNAGHISKSSGNIRHQREYFQSLSKDIYDLVKTFGAPQTLYQYYCPMVKASWLSEVKSIQNPYFGKSMQACGTIKETISGQ